ncbi:MAG: nucleotide sugar dehydrogenase [Candidatus Sericytochromatia bacterium]|nr:nucleotide sugar dehydrogenase [Candidatus Tanganyikabacteria bacterium]
MSKERFAVVGLGYVGLPVALGFAREFPGTIGFDINPTRISELMAGHDRTGEVPPEELLRAQLHLTSGPGDLVDATFFIVAVPTPIDRNNRPDLTPLLKASETVGRVLRPGAVVVFESTVYPSVTEDVCGPVLERVSGLKRGADFKLGYSPERINPGDREHTLERIVKVVSGEDAATLERVADAYGAVVRAGVHRAPSIKVAEAAKVIENTQRDLNIALMNELALIFERLGIRTSDVLAAAATKWNFLKFSPGLVGGHCIGVDPYYLTTKAEELGYHPQVILAGRRINDAMGAHVAQRLIKLLINADVPVKGAQVGILGLTFKEDVPDLRNSRVPDIIAELRQFGVDPVVHDPIANPDEAVHEYGVRLADWSEIRDLDGLVIAVGHHAYRKQGPEALFGCLKNGGVVIDVKSILEPAVVPSHVRYWSL